MNLKKTYLQQPFITQKHLSLYLFTTPVLSMCIVKAIKACLLNFNSSALLCLLCTPPPHLTECNARIWTQHRFLQWMKRPTRYSSNQANPCSILVAPTYLMRVNVTYDTLACHISALVDSGSASCFISAASSLPGDCCWWVPDISWADHALFAWTTFMHHQGSPRPPIFFFVLQVNLQLSALWARRSLLFWRESPAP